MEAIQQLLFIVQIIIAVLMTVLILFQKTDEDAISGIGGSGSGGNMSVISKQASGNILTKITGFLAIAFMLNCLLLATMISRNNILDENSSVIEKYIDKSKKLNIPN